MLLNLQPFSQGALYIPLLQKHVMGRSKVTINTSLQPGEVSWVRERRHLPEYTEGGTDGCSTAVLFQIKKRAFMGPLSAQKAEDWVPPDARQPLYCTEQAGDNPRHLHSHLSTHIHITKAAGLRGFICFAPVSVCNVRQKENISDRVMCFVYVSLEEP